MRQASTTERSVESAGQMSGWIGRGKLPFRLIFALLLAPVLLGTAFYVIAMWLSDPIAPSPLHVIVAAMSRAAIAGQRADSWDLMTRALDVTSHIGTRLYDTIFFEMRDKFQYPPTSLLWLVALGHLIPLTPAALNPLNALLFALNALGVAILFDTVALKPLNADRWQGRARAALLFLVFLVPYTFWPTVYGLYVGQIQIWIDLLFTISILLWLRDLKAASGVAIGLACTIKPQLAILLLWALAWTEWSFAIGLAATALVLGAISVMEYGFGNHLNYLDVLSYLSRHGEAYHPNQSMNGLLNRLLFNGDNAIFQDHEFAPFNSVVYAGTVAASLVFLAIPLGMAWTQRGRSANVLDLCVAALCCTMASPIAWEHHYGIALPAYLIGFALIYRDPVAARRRRLRTMLFISWLLVGSDNQLINLLSGTQFNVLQSYLFFGALLLLGTLCMMANQERSSQSARLDRASSDGQRSLAAL